jgi:N-methylhydantoinase A
VTGGQPSIAETTELHFRIPLRLPMIDVHTIGAGGGSIASIDRGGMLIVGPHSAGALPGPVCFGRGGTLPTVADANAVLARINPERPIGLKDIDRLDVAAARKALAKLGAEIGLDAEQTALAILTIVNQTMAGRTRLLTVEQGHDPRDFALVIFGGAGPLHGAAIMREVGIRTMMLPPHPGVQCALGCAIADIRYDMSLTVEQLTSEIEADWAAAALHRQIEEGERKLAISAKDIVRSTVEHIAHMSFAGQIHSLRVLIESDSTPERMAEAFREQYARENGKAPGDLAVMLVSLKTTVRGLRDRANGKIPASFEDHPAQPDAHRQVYFDGWRDTPIFRRETLLPGQYFSGPAIIEQADTTTVIEPDMLARVDGLGNILVEMAT